MFAAVIIAILFYITTLIESNIYMTLAAKIAMQGHRYTIDKEDINDAKDALKGKGEYFSLTTVRERTHCKWIRWIRLSMFALFIISFFFIN